MTAGAALSELEFFGVDGQSVRIESLWADRPALLVFLRHFG